MQKDITVLDDSDYVGVAESMVTTGEIYMVNVESMVANVIEALRIFSRTCVPGQRQFNELRRLNIQDHGNPDAIQIGTDEVSLKTLANFAPALRRLAPYFGRGGSVHLRACQVGQNRALLTGFARIFGVPVFAGTGNQNNVYGFNMGDYVRADPSGHFQANVSRP